MKDIFRNFVFVAAIFLLLSVSGAEEGMAPPADSGSYDPLKVSNESAVEVLDMTLDDSARGREIPLRIYLPNDKAPAPVVIFSHGLGGSCKGNAFLGRHWAARGYAAVFIQHPGSDVSVWQDKPLGSRMSEMKKAANAKNYLLRTGDVSSLITALEKWNTQDGHDLESRLDTAKIAMSGHSFGAQTSQALSGQKSPAVRRQLTDKRIKAAIMFSPSPPAHGSTQAAFGEVSIPWMLMTGTKDGSPIGNTTPEDRLKVFPALPPGDKYELVLHKAEHSAFTERKLPGETEPRNPNHHRAIKALSTAFLDAFLKADENAKKWLVPDSGAPSMLDPEDRYQFK